MLTAIKGYYEHGQITLAELPQVSEKTAVVVTFLNEQAEAKSQKRLLGALKGKIFVPEDFDEPLDDLKDYM